MKTSEYILTVEDRNGYKHAASMTAISAEAALKTYKMACGMSGLDMHVVRIRPSENDKRNNV